MHSLLVLVLAIGLVAADVGLGYNYKPPSFASYGVPSYQTSASSGQYNIAYNNANGLNYKVTGHNGHQGASFGYQNAANNVHRGNGGFQGFTQALGATPGFQNTYQGIYNGNNIYRETVHHQGENVGSYANLVHGSNQVQNYPDFYKFVSQPAQIFKHFYVHAAPEDEEPPKPRTPIALPPPQKHYKIIFIKAPTQAATAPQFIPVPQQNEEKTIVYVLVNKPEDAKDIVLPKVEQKPPAKPEVFFIKYNNKDGSQAVIDNIVKDYNKGQSVSFSDVSTGVPPPPALLLGTYGVPSTQGVSSANVGSVSSQNVASSEFIASSTETQGDSGHISKPLALGVSGNSDGTLASTFVGTGTTATSGVDNGYSSASSGTGFNSASSSTGYNGAANGAGYNSATSSTGFNSASSSTGLQGASGTTFSGALGGSGYNTAFGSNEYSSSSGISSTGAANSVTDSEYNGSTISTSQGVPHETYGIPKFRV